MIICIICVSVIYCVANIVETDEFVSNLSFANTLQYSNSLIIRKLSVGLQIICKPTDTFLNE